MEFIYQGKKYEISDIHKENFLSELNTILANYEAKQAAFRMQNLKDFNGDKFYIKNYQRGYRWTRTEIEELLNDINKIDISSEKGYCLQPLVVREIDLLSEVYKLSISQLNGEERLPQESIQNGSVWELIDGQQRLTTLWIILKTLLIDKYNVYYELERKVDCHYIRNAKKYIDEWLKNNDQDIFKEKLSKVFFIWYEIENENAANKKVEDVFASINDGKVPLTNAELFKALLLNECGEKDTNQNEEIAFEWDKLEENLRDDEFWYFISNDHQDKKTRIDYLLEVYARHLKDSIKNSKYAFEVVDKNGLKSKIKSLDFYKERFSFLVIQNCLEHAPSGKSKELVLQIWRGVVAVYNKLFAWYKDDELYHTIGFLVASEERKKGSKATANEIMCTLYYENAEKTFSEVKNNVKKKISEKYFCKDKTPLQVDDVCYEYKDDKIGKEGGGKDSKKQIQVDKRELRAILLFSNIFSGYFKVQKSAKEQNETPHYQRFPFKLYKIMNWDIEHIQPKELKSITDETNDEELEFAYTTLAKIAKGPILEDKDIKLLKNWKNHRSECSKIWAKYKEHVDANPNHALSNLALLDSSTNRNYGNALFPGKRATIIRYDKQGRFIPLCTKRVFLKYYSVQDDNVALEEENLFWWTDKDEEAYKKELMVMFEEIEGWRKNNG